MLGGSHSSLCSSKCFSCAGRMTCGDFREGHVLILLWGGYSSWTQNQSRKDHQRFPCLPVESARQADWIALHDHKDECICRNCYRLLQSLRKETITVLGLSHTLVLRTKHIRSHFSLSVGILQFHNNQLQVMFGNSVGRALGTGIAEVTGLNPVLQPEFFQCPVFPTACYMYTLRCTCITAIDGHSCLDSYILIA